MQELFIGETIRQKRLEAGKTQEQLCEGLCDPSTLSRIETGKQAPSRSVAEALLQRLGLPHDRYYTFLTSREAEIETLRANIDGCATRFRHSLAEEKRQILMETLEQLDRLKAITEIDDNITKQYILAIRSALGEEHGPYSFEVRLNILLEAIRLTVPQFDLETLGDRLYSINETGIISQIAEAYSDAGQHEKAASIFSQLLTYVREHYQNVLHPSRHLPPVTLSYTRELCSLGCYEEALKAAELGRKVCLDYGYCQALPGLLAVMAECKGAMGDYEQSGALYCQAYYLFKETGNISGLTYVKEAVGKRLGTEAGVFA